MDILSRLEYVEGDFYKRIINIPYNYCFELLSEATTRSEADRIRILVIISKLLNRSDLSDEFFALVKQI